MGYYENAKKFKCACGRWAMSVNHEITQCQKCRLPPKNHSKCKGCGKKFYSVTGKEMCRNCNSLQGNYKPSYIKLKTKRMLKNNCSDHMVFATDIKLLYVKMKHNLLTHIDLFRIASIYMDITCNEVKYSTMNPEEQCRSMISDMMKMVLDDNYEDKEPQKGRGVVRVDDNGEIIEVFRSVREAAETHDVYRGYVTNSCNRGAEGKDKKSSRLKFRWKNLI